MRGIKMTTHYDIGLDAFGNIAISEGLEAVRDTCVAAASVRLGEMVLAKDRGMPFATVAWDTYDALRFEAALREVLRRVDHLISVDSVEVTVVDTELRYVAQCTSTYGVFSIGTV